MIELRSDSLVFSFPEVHPKARLRVDFQRTLRIPDDGRDWPLPPGLGRFPLVHVDDHAERVPPAWRRHGGVMLPMYRSEAMWLSFRSDRLSEHDAAYPFAVKVGTGKVNAVSGEPWASGLAAEPQGYVVVPEQPWLDGYAVERGVIRQFVAMPLGAGYTAEEQLTGLAEHGGMQLEVVPMKREVFERRFPKSRASEGAMFDMRLREEGVCYSAAPDLGLAPGGRMRQEIAEDPYGPEDWTLEHTSRCFVHLCDSLLWRAITGSAPPSTPATAEEYTRHGLPWFDYDLEGPALDGPEALAKLRSVLELARERGDVPFADNASPRPDRIVTLHRGRRSEVREGKF